MKSFVATSDAVRQPNLPATYFSIKSTQCTREFSPYRRVIRKNSSTTCLASIEYTAPQPSSSRALVSQKSESKRRVEKFISQGASLYTAAPELKGAIESLIEENPTVSPGPATLELGQGIWEVFYAPHIANLSSNLGTRFQPIRYILDGDSIVSNVFYSSSLAQEGWLSSSGRLFSRSEDSVEVAFDTFWLDIGSTKLRPKLADRNAASGVAGLVDTAINAIGRAAFFPRFAVFPVKYLDTDLAVFSFPPLRDSLIAVKRVQ